MGVVVVVVVMMMLTITMTMLTIVLGTIIPQQKLCLPLKSFPKNSSTAVTHAAANLSTIV